MSKDNVNSPSHYTQHPSGVECIEITRHFNFNIGNVIKYCWRAGLKYEKNRLEDLEKARWYIDDEIKRIKEGIGKDSNSDCSQCKGCGRYSIIKTYQQYCPDCK